VKKARYAFAAVGVAPALGLLAPAATAAPAITHAQAGLAKTVRLSHAATTAPDSASPAPQYTCHVGTLRGAFSGHRNFLFDVVNYGHCVDGQFAMLDAPEPGLSERVRAYSQYGALAFYRRVGETIVGSHTLFPSSHLSSLNWNPVYQICAALVVQGTNNVDYGPVCITT